MNEGRGLNGISKNPTRATSTEVLLTILACWNLAVAYPILDVLSRGVEFFIFKHVTAIEIVLFAALLCACLPLLVILPVFLLKRTNPGISQGLFVVVLTVLVTLFVLPGLHKNLQFPPIVLLCVILLFSALICANYFRIGILRNFFVFLSPAILVIPAMFLMHSQIRKVLVWTDPILPHIKVQSKAPIIFLLFDEFPLTSLLNRDGFIDEKMYPNFSKFVRGSDWYRNATTVSTQTSSSIPPILTGNRTGKLLPPVARNYPRNLFTLFAESYELHAMEEVTKLCPNTKPSNIQSDGFVDRWRRLLSDTLIVYLHIVLPSEWIIRLPSVTGGWGNFAQPSGISGKRDLLKPDQIEQFSGLIGASEKPAVYFLHSGLPHSPWEYLPSGKKYTATALDGMFVRFPKWPAQESAAICAYQRHILQVGFTDYMFGKLISKLNSSGIYDRALVIVTSDHGASFRPGDDRRGLTSTNYLDIALVPLFIKRPGQKVGRVLDWNVESIDILPTIAEILNVKIPWKMDGVSVLRFAPKNRSRKRILNWHKNVYKEFHVSENDKQNAVLLRIERLGEDLPFMLPDTKLSRQWINTDIVQFKNDLSGKKVQINNINDYKNVELSSNEIPLFISGNVNFEDQKPENLNLGIAVNNRIRAVTKTFPLTRTREAFGSLIPVTSLIEGENRIQILIIPENGTEALVIPF